MCEFSGGDGHLNTSVKVRRLRQVRHDTLGQKKKGLFQVTRPTLAKQGRPYFFLCNFEEVFIFLDFFWVNFRFSKILEKKFPFWISFCPILGCPRGVVKKKKVIPTYRPYVFTPCYLKQTFFFLALVHHDYQGAICTDLVDNWVASLVHTLVNLGVEVFRMCS